MKSLTVSFLILMGSSVTYPQVSSQAVKAQDSNNEKLKIEYYKTYKEHFYKDDEPLQQLDDPKSETSFYLVKRNENNKIVNVGFYVRISNQAEQNHVFLTENINQQQLAYHYIQYIYNKNDQLMQKEYRDEHDKVLAYKKYIWKTQTNQLHKVEEWGETSFLGKMELKSFNEYVWEGESLRKFTHFNQNLKPVEAYHFIMNPNTGESTDPAYLVGNHKLSMFVLEKYERFRIHSTNKERSFYVLYEHSEANAVIQKVYNHDEVLVQEYPPLRLPEQINTNVSLIEE